jgi:hypothetical protein
VTCFPVLIGTVPGKVEGLHEKSILTTGNTEGFCSRCLSNRNLALLLHNLLFVRK